MKKGYFNIGRAKPPLYLEPLTIAQALEVELQIRRKLNMTDTPPLPEETVPLKVLNRNECREWVIDTSTEIRSLMDNRFASIDKMQRWLLMGRVINLLFSSHFKVATDTAEEYLKKRQAEFDGDQGDSLLSGKLKEEDE